MTNTASTVFSCSFKFLSFWNTATRKMNDHIIHGWSAHAHLFAIQTLYTIFSISLFAFLRPLTDTTQSRLDLRTRQINLACLILLPTMPATTQIQSVSSGTTASSYSTATHLNLSGSGMENLSFSPVIGWSRASPTALTRLDKRGRGNTH